MVTLLLGPDDFSKQQYIGELAKQHNAQLGYFSAQDAPTVNYLSQQDLFGQPKVFVVSGAISSYNEPEKIDQLAQSRNHIAFIEEKLDKRTTANKELLKNKKIEVKEYALPHGQELNRWIADRVKILGGKIAKDAVESLAIKLGRDDGKETRIGGKVIDVQEVYSLWQADSEIKKLLALAGENEISSAMVNEVVSTDREVDVFDLTNAIAEQRKDDALSLMHGFLSVATSADEKAAVIQLNALLAEQFRNLALVQDFTASRSSESEILDKTGWKPGRLFVLKKLAMRFPRKKIIDFLRKLEHLDQELKTGSTPPKVLLDLIMVQLF